jgi:hypothetical protein
MKICVDSLRVERRHTRPIVTVRPSVNNTSGRAQNAQNPGKRGKRGMRAKQRRNADAMPTVSAHQVTDEQERTGDGESHRSRRD